MVDCEPAVGGRVLPPSDETSSQHEASGNVVAASAGRRAPHLVQNFSCSEKKQPQLKHSSVCCGVWETFVWPLGLCKLSAPTSPSSGFKRRCLVRAGPNGTNLGRICNNIDNLPEPATKSRWACGDPGSESELSSLTVPCFRLAFSTDRCAVAFFLNHLRL